MSFDYRACFVLGGPCEAVALQSALASFGIALTNASTSIVYSDGKLEEQAGPPRDWNAFIADANSAAPSALGQFAGDDYFFDLGFVNLGSSGSVAGSLRVAWLQIPDGALSSMAYTLEDRNTDCLHLLGSLFRALNATSMAMGVEVSPTQFMKFFAGTLPLAEIDETICVAVNVPTISTEGMRSNPATKFVEVSGVQMLLRYFVGMDEYFSKS